MMKTKNKVLFSFIMSAICAASVAIAGVQLFTKDNAGTTKGVYEPNFTLFADAGATQTDTISSAWLFSEGNDYMLFATAFKVGEGKTYSEIGYTVTVDGTSTDYPSGKEGKTYYTGIRVTTADGVVEQTTQDIFGEIDATGMIVDEFEYDPSKAYVVTPYMVVEGGDKEMGKEITLSENVLTEACEHDFLMENCNYAVTVGEWETCSRCGLKSYAQYAHVVNSSGTIHSDSSNSSSGSRKNYTYSGTDSTEDLLNTDNYTAIKVNGSATWVNDSAASANIGAKEYLDYVFPVTADAAGKAKIIINARGTNTGSNNINPSTVINKCTKLFVNNVEYAIADNVQTVPYLEGYMVWDESELSVVGLTEGENTITIRFFNPGLGSFSGKSYGLYLSYMRVETLLETSCATGNHNLSFVGEVAMDCEQDGMQAHYVCQDCGLLFTEDKVATNRKSLIIESAKFGHVYDVPRYVDATTHTITCVNCEKEKNEAHNHTEGQTHLIIARAPNKVWFVEGETLDTAEMKVYTSTLCADGCKNDAEVALADIQIVYQNGTAFVAGDTYVTLKYNDARATLPVTVVATAEDMLTIDSGSASLKDNTSSNGETINHRTGSDGQTAYGGTYISGTGINDTATFTFSATVGQKGKIVMQACSNATVMGTKNASCPEYTKAISVNSVMIIKVNGVVVELSDNVLLKGCVSNLNSTYRWVWTNWDQVDLGTFDLQETNIVEITFKNDSGIKEAFGKDACGQIDCLNVFFE